MRRLATIALASVAIAALAGCVAVPTPPAAPTQSDASVTSTGFPSNMASHGIVETDAGVATTPAATATPVETTDVGGRVHVIVYLDLMCPYCGAFEAANGASLEQAVADGDVALETHPIAFLDSLSQGTEYSTRAANLVAAVADLHPDAAPAVIRALFEQQPAEGSTGLTDDELLAIAADAGAQSDALDAAVAAVAYRPFVEAATRAATSQPLPGQPQPLSGTPTVLVDGQQYRGQPDDAAAFAAMLEEGIG